MTNMASRPTTVSCGHSGSQNPLSKVTPLPEPPPELTAVPTGCWGGPEMIPRGAGPGRTAERSRDRAKCPTSAMAATT